jgi:hypothetical protein
MQALKREVIAIRVAQADADDPVSAVTDMLRSLPVDIAPLLRCTGMPVTEAPAIITACLLNSPMRNFGAVHGVAFDRKEDLIRLFENVIDPDTAAFFASRDGAPSSHILLEVDDRPSRAAANDPPGPAMPPQASTGPPSHPAKNRKYVLWVSLNALIYHAADLPVHGEVITVSRHEKKKHNTPGQTLTSCQRGMMAYVSPVWYM